MGESKATLIARIIQFLPATDPHFIDSPFMSEVPDVWFISDILGEAVTREDVLQAAKLSRDLKRDDAMIPNIIRRRILRYWYD